MLIYKPDIVQYISQHVDLKKSGQNYKGLCPLHDEKTPSFTVSPARQFYHCFGCGAGGDVFDFTMQYHNCTFKEALNIHGIDNGNSGRKYSPDPVKVRKKILKRIYQAWQFEYTLLLCDCLRDLDKAKSQCLTMAEVEIFADTYHKQETWEYEYKILLSNDEDAKLQLFREAW
jgi:DNA primase